MRLLLLLLDTFWVGGIIGGIVVARDVGIVVDIGIVIDILSRGFYLVFHGAEPLPSSIVVMMVMMMMVLLPVLVRRRRPLLRRHEKIRGRIAELVQANWIYGVLVVDIRVGGVDVVVLIDTVVIDDAVDVRLAVDIFVTVVVYGGRAYYVDDGVIVVINVIVGLQIYLILTRRGSGHIISPIRVLAEVRTVFVVFGAAGSGFAVRFRILIVDFGGGPYQLSRLMVSKIFLIQKSREIIFLVGEVVFRTVPGAG